MTGILRLDAAGFAESLDGLAAVLLDAFDDGASLGFVEPFDLRRAADWWAGLAPSVADGSLLVWAHRSAEGIDATISLALEGKSNGRHRASVTKLIVHRKARGQGLARALLAEAERAAAEAGVSLLLLDTETASAAEYLYLADGWTRYGVVPDYAASPDGSLKDCSFFYKRLG